MPDDSPADVPNRHDEEANVTIAGEIQRTTSAPEIVN